VYTWHVASAKRSKPKVKDPDTRRRQKAQRHYNRTHLQTRVDEGVRAQVEQAAEDAGVSVSRQTGLIVERWAARQK
jgi:hypothetical protein